MVSGGEAGAGGSGDKEGASVRVGGGAIHLFDAAVVYVAHEARAAKALAEEELALGVSRRAGKDALSARRRRARLPVLRPKVPAPFSGDGEAPGREGPLAPCAPRLVCVNVGVRDARGGDDVIVLHEPLVLG